MTPTHTQRPAAHRARTIHMPTRKPLGTRLSSTKPPEKKPLKRTKPIIGAPPPTARRVAAAAAAPWQQQQKQQPPTSTPARNKPKTTTIPLPSRPRLAPSPQTPHIKPTLSSLSSSHQRQQQQQQHQQPPHQQQHQSPRRIIEPTPDIRLPAKYKPAARRVTSIIVGLPIILVFGYELYNRYRREIRSKWEEREGEGRRGV